jgi:LysM repeat protein
LLSAFEDVEKSIASLGSAPKPSNTRPNSTKARVQSPKEGDSPPPTKPEKGYEYTVQEGDTLSRIVAALNKQGVKLTAKQISDANPGVNWNRLAIGHKLFIPSP